MGPTLDIHFYKDPVNPNDWLGPSFGRITTGYEWQLTSLPSRFVSFAKVEGNMDPALPGMNWFLDAIKYFGGAKRRYIKSLPQPPESISIDLDEYEINMRAIADSFLQPSSVVP